MKHPYALLLTFLASLGAHAQISIGQAEMPYAGDELTRVRAVTNPFINYTATGPAHTWNYANLAANTGDTAAYQTVASTNFVYAIIYADLFFNANRANHAKQGTDIAFSALLPITNPYTFRYRSGSIYKTVGYGVELNGLSVPILFDQHDVIYELPVDYGDVSSSHSGYHLDIPNVGYYGFEQDRTNEVDGWGSITTPGGTFDVLRVKTTLAMHDSISGFAIDRPVVREYKWLAQGLRVPVLQINTTVLFGTEVVNAIYYYDVPRTIEVVAPLANTICPGATVDVHYESTGAFNAGGFFVPANQFTAQLSDPTGSFANPVDIGSVTATTSGIITATIPANTPVGSGYRIRVISTSPDHIGTSNTFDISVGGTTVASISASGPTLLCTGDTLLLTAVGGPSYQWMRDGNDIGGAVDATFAATEAGSYTVLVDNACGMATSNAITVELNTPPLFTVDQTSYLICSGSTAAITAHDASGQGTLAYQWFLNQAPIAGATDTVVSATLGGIYTMQATNTTTGCSSLTEDVVVSLESVPTPEASSDGSTALCAGNSVFLTVPGLPFNTYQWYLDGTSIPDATATSLEVSTAGDYTVVTTNPNGCVSEPSNVLSVTVNAAPDPALVSAAGNTTFCSGDSVTLSIPAIPGNTYQWYVDGTLIDMATDTVWVATSSGDYTVTMTNAGNCTSAPSNSITVSVGTVAAPNVISTEPTSFCDGGGSTLIADALPDVTYQWYLNGEAITGAVSAQLTVLTAGTYTVTGTALNGCAASSAPVDVIVWSLPATPVISGSNDSLLVDGSGTFQWYMDGEAIPDATEAWFVPTVDGSYTVQVTDANGCSSTSNAWIFLTTQVTNTTNAALRVLPSPSSGMFTLEVPNAHGQSFEVLDATGKRVRSGMVTALRTQVDLSTAEEGLYFIRVTHGDSVHVLRMIIAR